ncbi:MAG: 50S ribosomal protein L35 [Candidatus Magasanikbacteria bacterium]
MPKAKTHKATAKRFKIKKGKKAIQIIKRTCGQDHFNSRESGNTKRNKRSDTTMSNTMRKTITRAIKNI